MKLFLATGVINVTPYMGDTDYEKFSRIIVAEDWDAAEKIIEEALAKDDPYAEHRSIRDLDLTEALGDSSAFFKGE